ncbi:uncharacterized protein BCR38DRAFT_406269 [Pseudomassariella vexata]|uniref:Nephrocystin 3-like N-terminal domain-containing protein n=1 Tax=Pseudomassariella vexata TaxID=1141098 RepID=A0A1Y2EBW0_9PEZI|nr:uncharacterized protein BCR38DRAFT_406269 [Pseudomassariella vexata]ORY68335.1 hypothetical protein BCR38DRAFT_406269 [Pseudomassariella vexata]
MKTDRIQIPSVGLHVIYEPEESGTTIADIVLVHGFGGHPSVKLGKLNSTSQSGPLFRDETSKTTPEVEVFWPLDLLPDSCGNARILTWGFHVVRLGDNLLEAQADIFDHADDLLGDLARLRHRSGALKKPVIFVAHSTGEVIVKEVLRRSETGSKMHIKDILLSTAAVIFFGSLQDALGKTPLSQVVKSMASVTLGVDTKDPVLARLSGADSANLEFGRRAFLRLSNDFNFKIKAFRDTRTMRSLLEHIQLREATSIANPREQPEDFDAEYWGISQFQSAEDAEFRKVADYIRRTLEDETTRGRELTPKEQTCLASLVVIPIFVPQVLKNFPGTCSWLYNIAEFRDWYHRRRTNDNRVLWISGASGSGKSTQLRHISRRIQKERACEANAVIWSTAGGQDLDRVFFTHRKQQQQATETGPLDMFRSLLAQLFPHDRKLREKLMWLSKASQPHNQPLSDTDLISFFLDDYMGSPIKTRLRRTFIFVDANEDCGPVYLRQLLHCLDKLAQNSNFSICLASRPCMDIAPGNTIQINVQDHNIHGIERYVHNNLKASWDERSVMVQKVVQKSGGLFLWAKLVTDLLNRIISEEKAQDLVDQILEELPSDLDGLYQWMLADLSAEEKTHVLVIMQWVMLASEPMRLNDLRAAVYLKEACNLSEINPGMVLNVGPPSSMSQLKGTGDQFGTPHQFHMWLQSRTLGLLEIKPDAQYEVKDGSLGLQRVGAIHESVRAFFLSGRGFAALLNVDRSLPPMDQLVDMGHYVILHTILAYINSLDLSLGNADAMSTLLSGSPNEEFRNWRQNVIDQRNLIMSSYPFLQYSVDNLLYHLLSPRTFRYFLPQQALIKMLSANQCRIWYRWTALLGANEPEQVISKCTSAENFLSPEFGAIYRLQRVFRIAKAVRKALRNGGKEAQSSVVRNAGTEAE